MVYKKIENLITPARHLADSINRKLAAGEKVSLFLSGGSAVGVAAEAAKQIHPGDLTVSLADERYGAPGHADSNWQQLLEAGFRIEGAKLAPVLSGSDAHQTLADYSSTLNQMLSADYKIALLGIGADGHTAGVLPGSTAAASKKPVELYEAGSYTRLTMTPVSLARLDEAIVYAVGAEKRQALLNLGQELDISVEPAQVLKQIPTVTVYNNLIGEKK